MGEYPAEEHAAGGVRKMGRKGDTETRRSGFTLRGWGSFLTLFFACFACFAVNSSAHDLDNLTRSIQTGTSEQKREALFQIRNLQTEAASRIAVPALQDGNEMVRATAASSVVFLPKSEAAKVLLPLLNDKAEFVRREAAYALGKAGDPSATSGLIKLLQNDKILEVRAASAVALGQIGDASAIESLAAILKTKPVEDDEFLRRSSARAIGEIAQIIQTGRPLTTTPQNFLPEKYKESGEQQYTSLSATFPAFRDASSVLASVLQNRKESDDARREAAFALGAIGDETAMSVLQANQNDQDYYLAEICKEALLKFKKPQ
jgi:HEAT repeat protein